MIRIRVEVGTEGSAVGATVQAESIGQALSLASAVFPGSELRVAFPLDPECFFVQDGAAPWLVEAALFGREAG